MLLQSLVSLIPEEGILLAIVHVNGGGYGFAFLSLRMLFPLAA